MLDDLRIIGRLAFHLGVGGFQKTCFKYLRRLSLPKSIASNGFCNLVVAVASLYRGADGRCQDCGTGSIGSRDDRVKRLLGQAWSGRIVNTDQLDFGPNSLKRVANAVKAFLTAQHDFDAEHGQIARILFLDQIFVLRRDGHNDLSHPRVLGEKLSAVLPHGFARRERKDLFEKGISKSSALTGSGQDDCDVFHTNSWEFFNASEAAS